VVRKNILIIGANGFLGKNLALHYQNRKNLNITLLDRDEIKYRGENFKIYKHDILEKKGLEEILKNQDVIYNFAGHSGALKSFYEYKKDIDINCMGMLNILDIIKEFSRKPLVVFPSSRLVYGKPRRIKIDEKNPKNPESIYAIHKLTVENYLKSYNNLFNIPYLIFRISIPYGFYKNIDIHKSYGIINYFINLAINDETITVYGDGSQKRDIINVYDLNTAIFKAVHDSKLKNKIFNLGGIEVLSIYEIAELIKEILGGRVESIKWDEDLKKIETGDMVLDSSNIYNQINFMPEIKLRKHLLEIKEEIK